MIKESIQGTPTLHREELANTLTHGIGAFLSIIGLAALLLHSSTLQDVWKFVSFTIYGISLFMLYIASTLYHAAQCPTRKSSLKTLDHCAIYLLIAGSYTPFLLVSMRDTIGWPMFAVVWGIALVGIILKLKFKHRLKALRVATYLVMGWLVVLTGQDLVVALPHDGLTLLAIGGAVYTLGVIFYIGKRIPFNHAIWHLFVLSGSACHYFTIYYYVLPSA